MSIPKRRTAILAGLVALSGLGGIVRFRKRNTSNARLPLPVLEANIVLRVVYGHNPRFDRAEASLIAAVLARAQQLCKSHFDLNLTFSAVEEQSIDVLFRGITPQTTQRIRSLVYDHKGGQGDRKRLIDSTRKVWKIIQALWKHKLPMPNPILKAKWCQLIWQP
jgi:hypothetical protein